MNPSLRHGTVGAALPPQPLRRKLSLAGINSCTRQGRRWRRRVSMRDMTWLFSSAHSCDTRALAYPLPGPKCFHFLVIILNCRIAKQCRQRQGNLPFFCCPLTFFRTERPLATFVKTTETLLSTRRRMVVLNPASPFGELAHGAAASTPDCFQRRVGIGESAKYVCTNYCIAREYHGIPIRAPQELAASPTFVPVTPVRA